jgi:hypothetical protein
MSRDTNESLGDGRNGWGLSYLGDALAVVVARVLLGFDFEIKCARPKWE